MKSLIFVFTLLLYTITCFSQLLDNNVTIHRPKNNKLYAGKSNLLAIEYKVDSFKNILVTSSQGEVNSIDKYLHYVDLKKKGTVQISVYDTTNGHQILLNQISCIVDTFKLSKEEEAINWLSDKCNLSIEDFSEVKIPISVVKKATKFKINPPYKIKSLTLYIGTGDVWTGSLNSGEFDSTLTLVWKRIVPGTIITLDNVVVIDAQKKTHKINGKSFTVTND